MSTLADSESAAQKFETYLLPILGPAYGTALHMTRHRDDAEDLVQESALQAFRGFHSFEPGTNFKAWFFRILTNLFINKYRRKQREPEVDTMHETDDAPAIYLYRKTREIGIHSWNSDPAAVVMSKVEADHIAKAITALPEEYRIVCALYFMEEFSYEEIAEMVGCPVGTVRSRLHRGRRMLQRALWLVAEEEGIVGDLRHQEESYAPDR
jgi:RNA polymerase sigma-70 factor, ECF subfamily